MGESLPLSQAQRGDGRFPLADERSPLLSYEDEYGFLPRSAVDHSPPSYTDWLGRPACDRDLGGWKCSACLICAYGFGVWMTIGVLSNLVVFLVGEWGWSNVSGATTVNTLSGTIYLIAFFTGALTDAYIGRAWTCIICQSLVVVCFFCATSILWVSRSLTSADALRIAFIVLLYTFMVLTGPVLVNLTTLGADQLMSSEHKELYFKLLSITYTVGSLLATWVVTYVDEAGLWVLGYWICTACGVLAAALVWVIAPHCRVYKVSGNMLIRIVQVFVAAWRRRFLPDCNEGHIPHGCQESKCVSCPSIQRTSGANLMSFLDKAAVLSSTDPKLNEPNPWHIWSVQQVQDLKTLLRVIPIGISFTFLTGTSALVTSLFEEQALVMDRQVTPWLILPPASLNFFSIAGALFIGFLNAFGGARWIGHLLRCCQGSRYGENASPLQMQGLGLVGSCWRLKTVSENGSLLSILWLVPQTLIIGASMHINVASSFDFFYREAPDEMRMASNCILFLFHGCGNFVNSILVATVTTITTTGGQKGWIPSDLNDGHLDYFYWFYASLLLVILCIHVAYASYYAQTKKLQPIYHRFS
ncbi:hypothetical protein KP509_17G034100 [Ceratopteris richardii]|uniref:Uncharacterized protein n=1 Tax=Ceratopteris richardii TaxID=49495 RepID=A0A8T2SWY2_CERRI|nr:hypothetical protein KP509_17G034100 [Ceratopteris richardii]